MPLIRGNRVEKAQPVERPTFSGRPLGSQKTYQLETQDVTLSREEWHRMSAWLSSASLLEIDVIHQPVIGVRTLPSTAFHK